MFRKYNYIDCLVCNIKNNLIHKSDLWYCLVCRIKNNLIHKSDLWYCLVCNIKNNLDRLPFTIYDNFELNNISKFNSMRFLESMLMNHYHSQILLLMIVVLNYLTKPVANITLLMIINLLIKKINLT